MKIEAQLLLESACCLSIYILWHHLEEVHPGIFSRWDKIHLDPSPLWHSERKFDWFIRPASPQPPFNETVIAHGRPALQRRMWRRGERQRTEMWTEYVTRGTINPTHTQMESEGKKMREMAREKMGRESERERGVLGIQYDWEQVKK